jgi:PKD repeat protein
MSARTDIMKVCQEYQWVTTLHRKINKHIITNTIYKISNIIDMGENKMNTKYNISDSRLCKKKTITGRTNILFTVVISFLLLSSLGIEAAHATLASSVSVTQQQATSMYQGSTQYTTITAVIQVTPALKGPVGMLLTFDGSRSSVSTTNGGIKQVTDDLVAVRAQDNAVNAVNVVSTVQSSVMLQSVIQPSVTGVEVAPEEVSQSSILIGSPIDVVPIPIGSEETTPDTPPVNVPSQNENQPNPSSVGPSEPNNNDLPQTPIDVPSSSGDAQDSSESGIITSQTNDVPQSNPSGQVSQVGQIEHPENPGPSTTPNTEGSTSSENSIGQTDSSQSSTTESSSSTSTSTSTSTQQSTGTSQTPSTQGTDTSSTSGETQDPPNSITAYEWNFGDGSTQTGVLVTHTYTLPGKYQVCLTVYSNTKSGSSTVEITVTPAKVEQFTISAPTTGNTLQLSWSPSLGATDYYIYRKDSSSDYSRIVTTQITSYMDTELTNGQTYLYTISAVAYLNNDRTAEVLESEKVDPPVSGTPSSPTLTQTNLPPHADACAAQEEGYFSWVNETITFDGSQSFDPDGHIIGYRWDFNGDDMFDTNWLSSPTVNHVYHTCGTFTVTLEVKDNQSATDRDTTTACIVKSNTLPHANAGGPYFGYVGDIIVFNGSKSYANDGKIVQWHWDFGDNSTGVGRSPTHIYTKNGTYTVLLKVTDQNGLLNTNTTLAVIVAQNRAPSKPEVTSSHTANNDYTFTAVSTDPDGDDLFYFFDFGNGKTTTSPQFPSGTVITAAITFTDPGNYTVKISAQDSNGMKSEITEITIVIVDEQGQTTTTLNDKSASANIGADTDFKPIILPNMILITLGVLAILIKKRKL